MGLLTQSRQERRQRGVAARAHLSRRTLAKLDTKRRRFDPIELLLSLTDGRLEKLLSVKYQRMSASPFAFFRGAVGIMAADLANQPNSRLFVQLCGDAHVENLGWFEGPDGRIVFDINDFDETIAGPWEWDVKRMAASLVLAGLESGHNHSASRRAAEDFAGRYFLTLEELSEQPVLTAARHQIRRLNKAAAVSAALNQAQRAQPLDLLKKYTKGDAHGGIRLKEVDKVLWPVTGKERSAVLRSLPIYRESLPPERLHLFGFFKPLDVGFKIVGTGSVGLRDYIVLMQGNGGADPLFLQMKQEVESAYAPYLKTLYEHQGMRVVQGQHKLQPISDLLLGWTRIGEHDYLVRQLNDHKGSLAVEQLRGEGLNQLAVIAGELLARGHARSGDALTIMAYVGPSGKVIEAIADFAVEYAKLTAGDFDAFQKAIGNGRIKLA